MEERLGEVEKRTRRVKSMRDSGERGWERGRGGAGGCGEARGAGEVGGVQRPSSRARWAAKTVLHSVQTEVTSDLAYCDPTRAPLCTPISVVTVLTTELTVSFWS